MGKKKRQSPPPPPPPQPVSTCQTEIDNEGLGALYTFQSGNTKEGLKMIRKSISIHQDSPNLHCIEAFMICNLALEAPKGTYLQLKALTNAVQSAKLLVELFPNSVEIYFLLALFCKLAQINGKDKEWEIVSQVCESTLKKGTLTVLGNNIVDILIGALLGKEKWDILYKESRIESTQQIIKWLQDSWSKKIHKLEGEENEDDMTKEDVMDPKMTAMKAKREAKEDSIIVQDLMSLERKQIEAIIRELEKEMKCDKTDKKVVKYSGLSYEAQRDFLKVNIEELVRHVKSLKDRSLVKLFSEALSFTKKHKTWKFWECVDCPVKFCDLQLCEKHFKRDHWGNSKIMVQSLTEMDIMSEWIEMIKNGVWKPVDIDMAIEIIVNVMKSYSNRTVKLPLCDDSKREEILESIHRRFLFLLEHRLDMAKRVADWGIQFAIYKFEDLTSLSRFECHSLKIHEVITSLSQFECHILKIDEVICCLRASQLEELLNFMDALVDTCGLDESSVFHIFLDNYYIGLNMEVSVDLNGDLSCLLLDDRFLGGELANDGSAIGSGLPTIGDCSKLWTSQLSSRRSKASKAYRIFKDEFYEATTVQRIFSQFSGEMEAVKAVESICIEEIKNRKQCQGNVAEPYLKLLRKQKIFLQRNRDNASKSKSETISHVLKEAEAALSSDHHGFEERDNCIKLELQKLKMKKLKKMAFADAEIMKHRDIVETCKRLIEKISLYDYLTIIVPVLKSFLQTRYEDLFDRDAKKKKIFKKAEESKAKDSDKNIQLTQKEAELDENGDEVSATEERKLEADPEHGASLSINDLGTGFEFEDEPVLSDNAEEWPDLRILLEYYDEKGITKLV